LVYRAIACSGLLAILLFATGCCHPCYMHGRCCHERGAGHQGDDAGYGPGAAGYGPSGAALAYVPARFHPVPTRPVFGTDPALGRPLEELPRPQYTAPVVPTPEQELRMLPDPDAAAQQQKKEDDALREESTPYGGNFLPGNLVP